MKSTPRKCALLRENVKIGLPISPINSLPTRPRSRERTRVQTLSNLVRMLGGVRTCLFVPLVDPCAQRGWEPVWCGIKALGEFAMRASRDDKRGSDTICHGTRDFEPVRYSRIPYYESKPSGSGTILIGFALPWAHQENRSSSQLVCVGFRLDSSSRLSSRLATSSPNSTGLACLNFKEYRVIVFSTRTPLKHVSNNQHNHHRQ